MSATAIPFYVTGGTLRQDAPSYVERQADRDLYEGLLQREFCYVLTSRQMGKSSLMVRTALRLRQEGVAVCLLDLTRIGQNLTAEQWYDGLLAHLGEALDLEDELEQYWHEHARRSPLQRWMEALRDVVLAQRPEPITLFIDEIDAVQSLPFSTDEFFAAIRECYNRRTEDPAFERLTFCLLGVASPSDLIQDTRTTPFNIGRRIELTDFTAAEAVPLAEGLGRDLKTRQGLLQRALYWTGGHPYLTQRLCRAVAEDMNVIDTAGVDRLCEALFLSPTAQEQDDNLLFVRERLLKSEVDRAALLDLYRQVRSGKRVRLDDTNELVSLLRLSGITRVAEGSLRVRNRIYERVFDPQWVTQHMPDAELRRQKAAYRRGLLRATAVASGIVVLMVGLTSFAWKQRSERQTTLVETRRQLYVARMGLVQQAWDAGNIDRALELLNAQRPAPGQEDLRGFEWRYFWQLCQGEQFLTLRTNDHTGAVAFSPDGKTLAFVSGTTIKLWDVASHRDLAAFQGHTRWVNGLAFSPDGLLLATASEDASVKLWDVALRREVFHFNGAKSGNCVAFSPDGRILAASWGDNTAQLWDVASRRELATLKGHPGPVLALAFSPDGKTLATGGGDETVRLWDVRTYQPVDTLHVRQGAVYCVSFSPDGRTLAAGSWGQDVRLWDVASRQPLADLRGHAAPLTAVAFSPDGKWLASGSRDKTVRLWDVASRREVHTFKGHRGQVWQVAFSPNGRTLASTGRSDETVRLWPALPPWDTPMLRGADDGLVFSRDGKTLAAKSWSRVVTLWDMPSGRKLGGIRVSFGQANQDMALSPDGRLLATHNSLFGQAKIPDEVELWETRTQRHLATLKGHQGGVHSPVFSPDGTLLAAGSDGNTIRLWDVATMREVATLKGHPVAVRNVAFSPDGKILATGSNDGAVNLWDAAARRQIDTLTGKPAVTVWLRFSPDGKMLAAGGADPLEEAGMIRLWDVASRRELPSLVGHNALVMSVDFSPDGKTLASASVDHTVKLWNLLTHQEVTTFRDLEGHSVAFSPDGTLLAAGRGGGTISLFRAATFQETDVPSIGPRRQASR